MGKLFSAVFLVWTVLTAGGEPLDRSQVLCLVVPSYGAFWGADLAGNLIPDNHALVRSGLFWALENLETLPLWSLDQGQGAFWTGMVNLGTGGASMVLKEGLSGDPFTDRFAVAGAETLSYFGWHTAFWSTYQAYADARFRADDPAYFGHPFRPASLGSLLAAPWDLRHLASWNTMTAGLILGVEEGLSSNNLRYAPWTTGKAYLGDTQVSLGVGLAVVGLYGLALYLPTAVGEEALFRGVEYEEWKVSFGVVPARVLEAGTFAAAHVPGDLAQGLSGNDLAFGALDRYLGALVFQQAGDEGGLARAVFVHFWDDWLLSLGQYLFNAGVPSSDIEGYRPLFRVGATLSL